MIAAAGGFVAVAAAAGAERRECFQSPAQPPSCCGVLMSLTRNAIQLMQPPCVSIVLRFVYKVCSVVG